MEQFNRAYLWGVDAKYRMGLYCVALLTYKVVVNALLGEFSVDSLTMVEMVLASFVFAGIETALFPTGKNWAAECSARRTALWAVLANVICIGGSMVFGWFSGVPLWGGAVLIVMLELCLFAMWYALWLETKLDTKLDTRALNAGLQEFQKK